MTHHEFLGQMILERFESDAGGHEVLRLARQGLRDERWGSEYVAAIGQTFGTAPESWAPGQIAAFTETHVMIHLGQVAELLIPAGEGPGADAEREANADVLARLPRPFRAELDLKQNNNGGDGVLFWDCPVPVTIWTGLIERWPDGSTNPLPLQCHVPAGHAVMEIGFTSPSRTLAHLTDPGGNLARWPYGSRWLRLFVNMDPGSFLPNRLEQFAARGLGEDAHHRARIPGIPGMP